MFILKSGVLGKEFSFFAPLFILCNGFLVFFRELWYTFTKFPTRSLMLEEFRMEHLEEKMESNLCMNCFAAYSSAENGDICPICGWNNAKPQSGEGLGYRTVLASRYVVGRVKGVNGEGITYAALDQTTKKVVEIREFFPIVLASREDGQDVIPLKGKEALFDEYLNDFIQLSKGISRLRELTVIQSVLDIFQENYTAYTVYEYEPSISLRRHVEQAGGSISWNNGNRLFQPVLTALGLMNSLGIPHLGISPDTLRVVKDSSLRITGFSIQAARKEGTGLLPELFPGFSAAEQYQKEGVCGEVTDVYGFSATLLFALTGQAPKEAPKRLEDQRLLISKEVLRNLPPFAVTAIANGLQAEQSARTGSFEKFKTELAAAPTIVNEVTQTEAIRRLPPLEMDLPQNRGLPPVVWLIGSLVITMVALIIVASMWLGDRGMSFTDLQTIFQESSAAAQTVEVPNMVNQSYAEWQKKIEDGEYPFVLKVSTQKFSDTVEEGNIISQSPFPEKVIAPGETVLVTVSKGSATRTLPEIKGMSFADLQAVLSDNGFTVVKQEEPSDDIEPGYVIRYQDAKEGDSLDYGASITVVVSSGEEGE